MPFPCELSRSAHPQQAMYTEALPRCNLDMDLGVSRRTSTCVTGTAINQSFTLSGHIDIRGHWGLTCRHA